MQLTPVQPAREGFTTQVLAGSPPRWRYRWLLAADVRPVTITAQEFECLEVIARIDIDNPCARVLGMLTESRGSLGQVDDPVRREGCGAGSRKFRLRVSGGVPVQDPLPGAGASAPTVRW